MGPTGGKHMEDNSMHWEEFYVEMCNNGCFPSVECKSAVPLICLSAHLGAMAHSSGTTVLYCTNFKSNENFEQ